MGNKNKFGLLRDVPEPIKRIVRQRDGFGCVKCGSAIIDYEHFDPEFKDAKEHNAAGIVLLCIMCHGLKTRRRLSQEAIAEAIKAPKARETGFSFGPLDVGRRHPEIIFGNVVSRNVAVLIRIDGEDIFRIREPEEQRGPYRISAFVSDRNGFPMMHIIDNEWRTKTSNWDVRIEAERMTIKSNVRDIDLVLRSNPPNQLIFERFNIRHRGISMSSSPGKPTVFKMLDGRTLSTDGMELDGCQVGVQVDGVNLMIGVGGGSVCISTMSLYQSRPDQNDQRRASSRDAKILPFGRK